MGIRQRLQFAVFAGLLLGGLSTHSENFGLPNGEIPIGGAFSFNLKGEPNTLNPLAATDLYAIRIFELTMDSLADFNIANYQLEPHLAERWEISKDEKAFTFYLRKNAKFHDGKPVTAEDVQFSFKAIMDPQWGAVDLRPFFENFENVEVVDTYTVKFIAKNNYFKNFEQAATMLVLPKHVYGDPAKAKEIRYNLIGAGPYKMDNFESGVKLILKRNTDWYGFSEPHFRGFYNFETLNAYFINDESKTLDMLKKGQLDYSELRADTYQLKTNGEPWGNKVLKVKYENMEPKTWYFYGWNFRNPLFKSRNVRVALSHLMNREGMIQKYLFGYAKPATSAMWFQNPSAPIGLKPLTFDVEKAQKLLKAEGWSDSDGNGILDKVIDGEKRQFQFTMIHANKDYEKFHSWYQEDLKKVGIDMQIKVVDWKGFEALIRQGQFEAMAMGWAGGDQDPDPKPIWHSSSIEGGANFVGYKNLEVDKLIDQARFVGSREKRLGLLRKIYEKIAEDAPYTFWFNTIHEFYGVSSRIRRPADSFKYKVGFQTWWDSTVKSEFRASQ